MTVRRACWPRSTADGADRAFALACGSLVPRSRLLWVTIGLFLPQRDDRRCLKRLRFCITDTRRLLNAPRWNGLLLSVELFDAIIHRGFVIPREYDCYLSLGFLFPVVHPP